MTGRTHIITGVSTAGKTTTLRQLAATIRPSGRAYRAVEHEDLWERGTVLREYRKKYHHPTQGWDTLEHRARFHELETASFDALLTYENEIGFNDLFVGVHPFVFLGLSYDKQLRSPEEQELMWNAIAHIYWLEPIPGKSHERGVDSTVSRYITMSDKHADFLEAEARKRRVPFVRIPPLPVDTRIAAIMHRASNPFLMLKRVTKPYAMSESMHMAYILLINSLANELGLTPP